MEQWEVIDLDSFFCLQDNRHQLNMCNYHFVVSNFRLQNDTCCKSQILTKDYRIFDPLCTVTVSSIVYIEDNGWS